MERKCVRDSQILVRSVEDGGLRVFFAFKLAFKSLSCMQTSPRNQEPRCPGLLILGS